MLAMNTMSYVRQETDCNAPLDGALHGRPIKYGIYGIIGAASKSQNSMQ